MNQELLQTATAAPESDEHLLDIDLLSDEDLAKVGGGQGIQLLG